MGSDSVVKTEIGHGSPRARTYRREGIVDCFDSWSLHSRQPKRLLACHRWKGVKSCRESGYEGRFVVRSGERRTETGAAFFVSGT